jgi:flagellar M-ring protein FliF
MQAAWTKAKTFVSGFSVAQKTIAILGVAGLVLGAVALSAWMAKPSLTPLFSGLQAADASKVVDLLQADGVQYEITDGGSTILVPQSSVYSERLKAAAAGLPSSKSSNGYSLLDNMGVTSSEFQQNTTYKRAMEGELANTISAMDGVKLATVQLAIPKDSVFSDQKQDPTASVFIETAPGVTLSSDQVQSIVHLTSASIDGLKPNNVGVVDSAGTTLSAVGAGATGSASKQATDYEKRVGASVQAMLDRVLGPGNATVAVAADMDTQSGQKVDETFTQPENAPALSESNAKENYTGTGGGAAGVLGPDNIAVPGGANGDGTFTSDKVTKDNAVNKTTQTTTIPAGVLKRQTVSVAVNLDAGANVAQVTNLVNAAAGINAQRGDVVTVESIAFSQAGAQAAQDALAAAKAEADAKAAAQLWQTIIMALCVLLLVALVLFLYARKNRKQKREDALLDLGEKLQPLPIELGPSTTAIEPPVVQEVFEPPVSLEDTSAKKKRQEIGALAEQDPDKTASYLRGMMDERQLV